MRTLHNNKSLRDALCNFYGRLIIRNYDLDPSWQRDRFFFVGFQRAVPLLALIAATAFNFDRLTSANLIYSQVAVDYDDNSRALWVRLARNRAGCC